MIAGALVACAELITAARSRRWQRVPLMLAWNVVYPLALLGLLKFIPMQAWPMAAQIALALAIIVPMGPMVYRLAYQPLADASVLMLLIVSVAVHVVMVGLGLLVFGAEGSRTPAFSDGTVDARHADRERAIALGDRLLASVDRGVQRFVRPHGVRKSTARHRDQSTRCAADGNSGRVRRQAFVLPVRR